MRGTRRIAEPPVLLGRRQKIAALTAGMAVTLSVLDGVMLNATLPTIAVRFQTDPAKAIWLVNAYQLAAAMVLLPLGKAADIYGHKRVYLSCVALFGIASFGCAQSMDMVTLAAWRFAQGCGGAGIMGITNAMLRFIYPPDQFGRGVALNSMLVAMTLAAGPTIASLLITFASWPWLFLVNLPIVGALLAVGVYALPIGSRTIHGFDWISASLSMATFGTILLSMDAGAHNAPAAMSVLLAMSGIGMGALLLRRQRDIEQPLFPVDILLTRRFGLSVATMFAASSAQLIAYLVLPFHFQADLGRTQIESGLLFLPWPIALAVAAPIAGRLGDRMEAGLQCAVGLGIFALGLLLLGTLTPQAGIMDIAWRMALSGFGYGIFQPPNSRTLITSAPPTRVGSASVMGASARVMGQAVGAAVTALLFRILPVDGRAAALYVAVAFATAGIALSLFRRTRLSAVQSTR